VGVGGGGEGELMTWRLLVCWSVKQKETKGNKKEIKLRKKEKSLKKVSRKTGEIIGIIRGKKVES
jgi:hypothetical protein